VEIKPQIKYVDETYVCSGGEVVVRAETPEEAYALWLSKFEYKGPPLPSAEKLTPSRE
jgi:hypothetical protein